ncbi:hypothetical protein BLA29_009078 [Euroglyphus maynei]|uniref:Uncharacterized protein n=1 Tax=Euroglyphus maynei TaxID=6958 RepID=A0A1Y3BL52_EURMA|nr:hypothetical protein BLA29_009078 [Euroglyphus maynei]
MNGSIIAFKMTKPFVNAKNNTAGIQHNIYVPNIDNVVINALALFDVLFVDIEPPVKFRFL